jgi:hypothetical protein
LRETFKDGPRAAARAQAVYAIWKLGVTETGREVHPISYAGAEWQIPRINGAIKRRRQ